MPELFASKGISARGNVIPYAEFTPFAGTSAAQKKIVTPNIIAEAEKLLDRGVPALPASLYMEYYRTGNRSHYEGPYFARRNAVTTLLFAEMTERKGRFTDLLVDYIWAVCEESTWVIPAHNRPDHGNPINCLPDAFMLDDDDEVKNIDLFSASTAAVMSLAWYFGGEILDGVTPVIRRRIRGLIKKRIFRSFYDESDNGNGWIGAHGGALNNWTPWIVSNILLAVMLCEDNDSFRELAVEKSMVILDRFTKNYPDDGGCDEGPGYWGVAGASYFDCVEIISDLTGGRISLTDMDFLRRMCEYHVDFNLCGNVYANFADAGHLLGSEYAQLARMGRRLNSDKLKAYVYKNGRHDNYNYMHSSSCPYRSVMNVFEPFPDETEYSGRDIILYPDLEVMIAKNPVNGMALAAKGGSNAESHNHNDIGQFILFKNGKPVFIDPGVETYCKDTFSSKRYTLWTMRSLYHNLPEINGCEQKCGGQYRAEIISCENGEFTTQLRGAYPPEAGIVSYIRTVALDDSGAHITDRIELEQGSGDFTLSLMCAEKPVLREGGLTLTDAGAEAEFGGFDRAETDSVPLDAKLTSEWSTNELTRVRLFGKTNGETVFTVDVK